MPLTSLRAEAVDGVTLHAFGEATPLGFAVMVSDRFGGVSTSSYASLNLGLHVGDDVDAVQQNRERLERAVGQPLRLARQVHGRTVLAAHDVTSDSEADGLVTDENDALAVLVADCVPLALVHPSTQRFAVVHAGWRGLVAGVIAEAVQRVGHPDELHAFMGPSISGDAYQVGPEVAEAFRQIDHAVRPDGGDRSRLDLRRVAEAQLTSLGLVDDHIYVSREVTDGGDTFFSDRAQRPCGRFALIAKRAS